MYSLDTAAEHWAVAAALAQHHEQAAAKLLQRFQVHCELKNWRHHEVLIYELLRDISSI
jgi:hypothetical protein